MRKVLRWLTIGAGVFGALLMLGLFDSQRQHLGNRTANVLLIIEIAISVCIYIAYRFWEMHERQKSIAFCWLPSTILLFFLGWLVQPAERFGRAIARLGDWEGVVGDYSEHQKHGTDYGTDHEPPDPPEKAIINRQRIREELSARKLEYRAGRIRYHGAPGFFRSGFLVWSMWIFRAISLPNSIVVFSKNVEKS